MLNPKDLFEFLCQNQIKFFSGVPDSLLKYFCAYLSDHCSENNHIISANEGNAIGLAAGNYLGSQNPSLVYLQNSGIGNITNALKEKGVWNNTLIVFSSDNGGKEDEEFGGNNYPNR